MRRPQHYADLIEILDGIDATYQLVKIEGGTVLREYPSPFVHVDWVAVGGDSGRCDYRVVVRDSRRVRLAVAGANASGSRGSLEHLSANVTSEGIPQGWTRLGAGTNPQSEDYLCGLRDLEAFRAAVLRDAAEIERVVSTVLEGGEDS